MKVLQVLTQATGGPCDHAADVAVELQRQGHECLVVMGDGPAARRVAAAGVRTVAVGPVGTRDAAGTRALVRLLRAERADVVHCHDRRAGLVGRALSSLTRAGRTVYTLHGVPDSLSGLVAGNLQVDPPRRGDRLLYLRSEQALAAVGRGPVVVPSAALAAYATGQLRLPARQVHVVPNGVDVDRFAPGDRCRRDGALDVLWLGALVPTKRVDVLLRTVAEVPGVTVRLAGLGELEDAWRRLADELGVADRVSWLGWVDDPAPLLASADVLALPSAAENLPLVVLQAMASGAAVVASRVGGLPEAVGEHDGVLVSPGDVPALAAALRALRDDAARRDRLGAHARATASTRFAQPVVVRQLLEVYS